MGKTYKDSDHHNQHKNTTKTKGKQTKQFFKDWSAKQ
jgi:hypothetical protein